MKKQEMKKIKLIHLNEQACSATCLKGSTANIFANILNTLCAQAMGAHASTVVLG